MCLCADLQFEVTRTRRKYQCLFVIYYLFFESKEEGGLYYIGYYSISENWEIDMGLINSSSTLLKNFNNKKIKNTSLKL